MTELFPLQQLLCLPNHEDCPTCQEDGFTPSLTGRECLHRHEKLFPRVTHSFADRLRHTNSRFSTDNEGFNSMLLAGNIVLEAAFALADLKDFLLSREHCLQIIALIQQGWNIPDATNLVIDRASRPTEPQEPQEAPEQTLWKRLEAPLKERVSETNYETWLSALFVADINHPTMTLGCTNTFFQEYLTEHYKAVIQEELANISDLTTVEFVVAAPQPIPQPVPQTESPAQTTADPEVEVLPKQELTPKQKQLAKRKADLHNLINDCTIKGRGRPELFVVLFSHALKLLQAQEAEEDRIEQERARFERWQAQREQRPKDSAFDSTKTLDRKQQKKMLAQSEHDLDKEGSKPPNSG